MPAQWLYNCDGGNGMNTVILKGNLTHDPEVKEIKYGDNKSTHVANFSIAVSRFFKRANGDKDKDTTFIPCEAWDTGAETIGKYLHKGDPVLIQGTLKMETWETQEGAKRSRLKVRVATFDKLYRAPKSDDYDGADNTSHDVPNDVPDDGATNEPDANEPF